ncbi:MAG: hypothetical protein K2X11_02605 [Acetobacteraceae bacterium]|nr:hypothetical protein [Acetobacteraceae bacterium]
MPDADPKPLPFPAAFEKYLPKDDSSAAAREAIARTEEAVAQHHKAATDAMAQRDARLLDATYDEIEQLERTAGRERHEAERLAVLLARLQDMLADAERRERVAAMVERIEASNAKSAEFVRRWREEYPAASAAIVALLRLEEEAAHEHDLTVNAIGQMAEGERAELPALMPAWVELFGGFAMMGKVTQLPAPDGEVMSEDAWRPLGGPDDDTPASRHKAMTRSAAEREATDRAYREANERLQEQLRRETAEGKFRKIGSNTWAGPFNGEPYPVRL